MTEDSFTFFEYPLNDKKVPVILADLASISVYDDATHEITFKMHYNYNCS